MPARSCGTPQRPAGEHKGRACLGQALGHAEPDAAGPAGEERDAAGEVEEPGAHSPSTSFMP